MARMRMTRSRTLGAAAVMFFSAVVHAQTPPVEPPLDAIQRAVIESIKASLELPGGRTPPALLDAAIKANDVGVPSAAERYLAMLAGAVDAAGAEGLDTLADLADANDEASIIRLEQAMRARQPAAAALAKRIIEAGRMRRRDATVLNEDIAALASPVASTRFAAAERLVRTGIDALPALVGVLGKGPGDDPQQFRLARGIVERLGFEARQPLLDWLATGDPGDWAGVIEAIDASGAEDIEVFLLAPALVPQTPPAAKEIAQRVLRSRALARGGEATDALPSVREATARLAGRLDRLLTPSSLPPVDHLLLEPITDPSKAKAAYGGSITGTVDRYFWNPETRVLEAVSVPPQVARAREAMHFARYLQALDVRDEATVDLVLLANLEAALATGGDPITVLDRVPAAAVREVLSGPDGFSIDAAGRVFEQAVERGMWLAARAVATGLVTDGKTVTAKAGEKGTLPPPVRDVLIRSLDVPDAALQFAAARALVLTAGEPPYRGSSRVVEVLLHAATSTGIDRVVVAHPHAEVAHVLASGVSRFGYEPVRVSTGREAVFAARSSADTVLALVAARIPKPTAIETVQFLRLPAVGDIPAVLVVVDPLDDDGRGKYLTKLLLSFCEFEGVGIIDRLDSVFEPTVDPETNKPIMAARFPDLLAQAAGPGAVDPDTRNALATARLNRAREAFGLLGRLSRRGQDVSPVLETARLALNHAELYAPAASLLASLPSAEAQEALEEEARRPDLPDALRLVARSAFETSVDRFGLLLESRQLLAAYARYNEAADDTTRGAAGSILDVIEAAGTKSRVPPTHAPPKRPRQ
jgi:CheY-like chemotaxis protein